jgi:hypothetical protein
MIGGLAMRRLVCLLGLLWLSVGFSTERLSNGFTQHPEAFFRAGFWWDQSDPGWGIDLHMSGDVMVGAWATHDQAGQPTWYLGVGTLQGDTWVMPMQQFSWNDGQVSAPSDSGLVSLQFESGSQAIMDWSLGESVGQYRIEPLLADNRPIAEDRTGFWYDTSQPGYGMSVVTQGPLVMTVFFFYDQAGQPRWVWADNIGSGELQQLDAYSFAGNCPGCPDVDHVGVPAGQIDVAFLSENHASLSVDLQVPGQPGYGWQRTDRTIHILSNRASGRQEPFALMPFTNQDTLQSYLAQGLVDPYPSSSELVNFSPAAPLSDGAAISNTNLQETGVDEADVIKSDGEIIYAVVDGSLVGEPHRLRVMRIDRDAETDLTELTEIEVGEGGEVLDGLYLLTDRPDNQPDLLVVSLGGSDYHSIEIWFSPWFWTDSESRLIVFDISNPAEPEQLADILIDGTAVETRRIGEQLYHVSRFQPDLDTGEASNAERIDILANTDLDDLLPQVTINGQTRPLVSPDSVLLPPQPPGSRDPDLVTVAAFDLTRIDQAPQTISYAGLAETVYVSTQSVFVASSRYAASTDPGFGSLSWPHSLFTDIHQIALSEEGPRYLGSGVAEGFLSWGGTGASFSMSEFDDHLRLVTSSASMWPEGEHRVTVMSLPNAEQPNLRVVGVAPNANRPRALGKPGEALYGLRFAEERLYAVSFKQIDPLYVVDLADPKRPAVLGELEVTGFSDYLHPLPNNLLLGVGKAAVPVEGFGDGNFAW